MNLQIHARVVFFPLSFRGEEKLELFSFVLLFFITGFSSPAQNVYVFQLKLTRALNEMFNLVFQVSRVITANKFFITNNKEIPDLLGFGVLEIAKKLLKTKNIMKQKNLVIKIVFVETKISTK